MGVSGDPFVIVWLDEQKEISHLWVKTVTRNLSPTHLEKIGTIIDLRQEEALPMGDIVCSRQATQETDSMIQRGNGAR